MTGTRPTRRRVLGTLASGAIGGSLGQSIARSAPEEFKFGLTPVFLTSDLDLLGHLKVYLERNLDRAVKLVTRRTYQEITALLISGQLDAAWICGYPFVAYRPQLSLVAVPLWQGKPLYRSYLITGINREANSLDDLRGDTHAFSDPDSNSGWLVTATALALRKSSPTRFFKQTFFTWGHRNVVRAVASGLAMSGSVDGYVYEVMRETEPDLVAQTHVVRKSELLGFPPIASAAAIAQDAITIRFQSALTGMTKDHDGRTVLQMLRLDGFSVEDVSLFDSIAAEVAIIKETQG